RAKLAHDRQFPVPALRDSRTTRRARPETKRNRALNSLSHVAAAGYRVAELTQAWLTPPQTLAPRYLTTYLAIYLDKRDRRVILRYIVRHNERPSTMHHHRDHRGCDDGLVRFMSRKFGGHQGFGPFGRGFGGGGGNMFRAGRMLADGDLRLITLSLIEKGPRHGYDLIKALEELSSGIYSPSPGVVYPTLTFLEEAGYATSSSEGNKKIFAITDSGRAHLEENREIVDGVLEQIERFGEK